LGVPVFYECQRCTACCRWPGQVKLTQTEIAQMAQLKGMDEWEFIQAYTRLRSDRQGLALHEKPNGECVFLEDNNCAIQSCKPQQCRDFPNHWNFPGFGRVCRALPRPLSEEEYAQLVRMAPA
jgi:hypothetical protein